MNELLRILGRICQIVLSALSKLGEKRLDAYISQGAGELGQLGGRDGWKDKRR